MAKIAYSLVSEIVGERAELSTFNNLLRRSGVIVEVDRDGPYTLLAPTNDAFDRLPRGALGGLVDDADRLRRAMSHHVADGLFPTASVFESTTWPTLHGEPLFVMPAENGLVVGSALVVEPDITADNGLVHIIDTVLLAE